METLAGDGPPLSRLLLSSIHLLVSPKTLEHNYKHYLFCRYNASSLIIFILFERMKNYQNYCANGMNQF